MQTFVFLCTSPIAIEEGTHIYIWSLFQPHTAAQQCEVQKYLEDHFSIQTLYIDTEDLKKKQNKNDQDKMDCHPSALICGVRKIVFYGTCPPKAVQKYLDSRGNANVSLPASTTRSISRSLIAATSSCSQENPSVVRYVSNRKVTPLCLSCLRNKWLVCRNATALWTNTSVQFKAHVTLCVQMCTQLHYLHFQLFPLTFCREKETHLVYLFIFKPLKMLETAKAIMLSILMCAAKIKRVLFSPVLSLRK